MLQIWGLAGVKPLFVSTLKVKRETKLQQETEIGDLGYSAGPSHVVFYFERSSVSGWAAGPWVPYSVDAPCWRAREIWGSLSLQLVNTDTYSENRVVSFLHCPSLFLSRLILEGTFSVSYIFLKLSLWTM